MDGWTIEGGGELSVEATGLYIDGEYLEDREPQAMVHGKAVLPSKYNQA